MAARETKPNGKSQLIRDLKNGEFATLYIISGEESYMKEYYLRQLRQKVVDETFADFNLIEFEGKGLTPEMLTEAIDSYPAMADKKLIIVKDFDLFKPPAGFADHEFANRLVNRMKELDTWQGAFKSKKVKE